MLSWLLSNRHLHGSYPHNAAHLAAGAAVEPLDRRVESLELACAGLWDLLKNKLGCTDDELVAAVQAVDARDGTVDGKISIHATPVCPHCGRKMLTRNPTKCAWCGVDLMRMPFTGG